jgi:hypothetical protein
MDSTQITATQVAQGVCKVLDPSNPRCTTSLPAN